MKRDPAAFLPFDAWNPELIRRFEMAPVRMKDLADPQKRVKPERQRTIQMLIHFVSRIDRQKPGALFFGKYRPTNSDFGILNSSKG